MAWVVLLAWPCGTLREEWGILSLGISIMCGWRGGSVKRERERERERLVADGVLSYGSGLRVVAWMAGSTKRCIRFPSSAFQARMFEGSKVFLGRVA